MDTNTTTPADGQFTDNGRPKGFSTLTPFVALKEPQAALAFYEEVFNAETVSSTLMNDELVHAEVQFTFGRLQLGSAQPEYHLTASDPATDETMFSLGIYVPNVDEVVERAVARGATLREQVTTFVSGDRFGSIRDPFGVRWSVMTRIEDLSDEESSRRVAEWAETMNTDPSA